jgi:hypothetical protein
MDVAKSEVRHPHHQEWVAVQNKGGEQSEICMSFQDASFCGIGCHSFAALEHVRGNIYVKFRLFTNKTHGHDIISQIRSAVQVDS